MRDVRAELVREEEETKAGGNHPIRYRNRADLLSLVDPGFHQQYRVILDVLDDFQIPPEIVVQSLAKASEGLTGVAVESQPEFECSSSVPALHPLVARKVWAAPL